MRRAFTMLFGLPISTPHRSIVPAEPGTSSWIDECGLVHENSTTVPSIVTLFVMSNITGE